MSNFKKSFIAVSALLLLAALLTGCARASSTIAPTVDLSVQETPAPVEHAVDPTVSSFGETFIYEDGISISVKPPVEFTASEFAEGTKNPHQLAWEIEVVNGSGEEFRPQVFPEVWHGDLMGWLIMDASNPIGDFTYEPGLPIQTGETYKFLIGYSVTDLEDLRVIVSPGFEYEEHTFTNVLL